MAGHVGHVGFAGLLCGVCQLGVGRELGYGMC